MRLHDRVRLVVPAKVMKAIVALVDNPPPLSPRLRVAMKKFAREVSMANRRRGW